jgi:predicted O-methyltransferase YrrM
MVSKNAIKRALSNPLFTVKTAIYYLLFKDDVGYLRKQLATRYSERDIKNFSIGASVGLKEVAIYLIVRKFKPRFMVETGVANGISTYFILKAMDDNGFGRLISIDLPNYNKKGYITSEGTCDGVYIPKEYKPGWVVPASLTKRWSLLLGKSKEKLPTINGKIDAFYHDSEHSYDNMMFEFEWAYSHLKVGGILLADDTNRNSAFTDFCRKYNDKVRRLKLPISCAIKK